MLLTILIGSGVYIGTFKNDFTEEHIQKVTPVLFVLGLIFVIVFITGVFGFGRK